ncbi:MAG: HD domain-containing phosphohydrolase [Bdellovibrionota bacterium]
MSAKSTTVNAAKKDVAKKGAAKKHVLVVDDDDVFRSALVLALSQEGFQVTQAAHGKLAKDVIGIQDVDAVISDINMPGVSGIELMHFCRKEKPNLPVILMTGFAELKETKEAYELGARGFLPKPFKKEELLSILHEWLYPKAEEEAEEENQDLNYCKLSIDDFISGREIKYDIYVRISEKKYLKVAHQGEDLPLDRIQAYKAKNIRYLYMLKDDFRKYMGFNLTLLPLVNAKSSIPKEKKRAFLKHTNEVIMEHLYLNGVDEEGFQSAKAIVESTTSLLTEPDDMMNLMGLLNSHADHLYAHGLGVSTYSVMIAKKVGWHSTANIYKIAMGGLLHDIGKKEIPREILDKQRKDMTAEEVQLYETHPQRGMDLLGAIPSVPSDVLQIALQHHENCLGLGFPMRLTKQHIHPMARLVSVANEFCTMVLKGPSSLNLSPPDAIQRMNTMQAGKFDQQFIVALMKIFKIPAPPA